MRGVLPCLVEAEGQCVQACPSLGGGEGERGGAEGHEDATLGMSPRMSPRLRPPPAETAQKVSNVSGRSET